MSRDRFPDVHPDDIDPETGRPYANYSSPALEAPWWQAEQDALEAAEDPGTWHVSADGRRLTAPDGRRFTLDQEDES